MRALLVLLLGVTLALGADPEEEDPLAPNMEGEYVAIGRLPDSGKTYSARVTLRLRGKDLEVSRTIDGKTITGVARLESSAVGDKVPVLRMRFTQDGKKYEGTFLWRTDLDNYFRFSGYVYLADGKTEQPGLEALFPFEPIDPAKP